MINAATLNIKTKPFMHTSWNQAISATPMCTVLLSVSLFSVSHRTQDSVTAEWCFLCLISVDFMWCLCGMQEIWRYFKGHTRKCAGCIIRIKLCGGKVILTWTQKRLWLVWFVYEMNVWISLPMTAIYVKRKKNTTRNSSTFIRRHKSEQSMEAEWWVFF